MTSGVRCGRWIWKAWGGGGRDVSWETKETGYVRRSGAEEELVVAQVAEIFEQDACDGEALVKREILQSTTQSRCVRCKVGSIASESSSFEKPSGDPFTPSRYIPETRRGREQLPHLREENLRRREANSKGEPSVDTERWGDAPDFSQYDGRRTSDDGSTSTLTGIPSKEITHSGGGTITRVDAVRWRIWRRGGYKNEKKDLTYATTISEVKPTQKKTTTHQISLSHSQPIPLPQNKPESSQSTRKSTIKQERHQIPPYRINKIWRRTGAINAFHRMETGLSVLHRGYRHGHF
ncbi:hypothetical protein C8R44DRAFT_748457 [Mycena epipterygia]|nr:hypothetical protein C8R44DRAFT_748457 [Mycena epipterygia]